MLTVDRSMSQTSHSRSFQRQLYQVFKSNITFQYGIGFISLLLFEILTFLNREITVEAWVDNVKPRRPASS